MVLQRKMLSRGGRGLCEREEGVCKVNVWRRKERGREKEEG